jgi:hypothetical protein
VVTGQRGQYLGVLNFTAVTDHIQTQQQAIEEATDREVSATSTPEHEHPTTPTDEGS